MFRSSVGSWRHMNCEFGVEILKNVNNQPLCLCKILRLVTVMIVINSSHVAQHLALHPAGIAWPSR